MEPPYQMQPPSGTAGPDKSHNSPWELPARRSVAMLTPGRMTPTGVRCYSNPYAWGVPLLSDSLPRATDACHSLGCWWMKGCKGLLVLGQARLKTSDSKPHAAINCVCKGLRGLWRGEKLGWNLACVPMRYVTLEKPLHCPAPQSFHL